MSDGAGDSAPEPADNEVNEENSQHSETAGKDASNESIREYDSDRAELESKEASDLTELEKRADAESDELRGHNSKVVSIEEYRAAKNENVSYAADYLAGFADHVESSGLENRVGHSDSSHSNKGLEGKLIQFRPQTTSKVDYSHLLTKSGKIKTLWDRVVNSVITPFYYLQSAMNLFEEDVVAERVKNMLESQAYTNDNTITILLHGSWQNSAGSYEMVQRVAEQRGLNTIPLTYDYTKPNTVSAKKLLEEIIEIKERTGATIYMAGHSQGATVGKEILRIGGHRVISRFIPFSGIYGYEVEVDKSVIEPLLMPEDMKGSPFQNKLEDYGNYKIPLTLHEDWGLLIHGPHQKMQSVPAVPFNGGHMQLLYDEAGINLLLDSIYHPEQIVKYAVNKPDPVTKVIDYASIKKSELRRVA